MVMGGWLSDSQSQLPLYDQAIKTVQRARRKHEEALTELSKQLIDEIKKAVLEAANHGLTSVTVKFEETPCYNKMCQSNEYLLLGRDELLLTAWIPIHDAVDTFLRKQHPMTYSWAFTQVVRIEWLPPKPMTAGN